MKGSIDSSASWIPSPEDEMLLMAALAPEGKANDAGLAWLTNMNLTTQGEATNRLLPLVHDRLLRDGIDHPAMAILKGVRRKVWCRNQLLFKHAAPAVQALCQAGIDVMFLKGTALTLNYYQDYGLRPMGDFDMMVRFKDVAAAMEILREKGWEENFLMEGKFGRNILIYNHAMHFKDSSGLTLDFHWHLLPFCVNRAADSAFWNASITAKFDTVDVRVLNPADQLLHVCVHGLMWSGIPGIRWIPDSLAILYKAPELDWNRLLLQTQEGNLLLFMRSALNYLVDRFGAPIPCDVLRAMNVLPVTSHGAREFTVLTERRSSYSTALGNHYSIPKALQVLFYTYRRIVADAKLCGYNVTVMEYLCAYYCKKNVWRLFFYIFYRIGGQVSRLMNRVIMVLVHQTP